MRAEPYPFGWAPPDPGVRYGAILARLSQPPVNWKWEQSAYFALRAYLQGLVWPHDGSLPGHSLTLAEMAIDLEVSTGARLLHKTSTRPGVQSNPSLAVRVRVLGDQIRAVESCVAPHRLTGGAGGRVAALVPLGLPRSQGFSQRPKLAGGARTEAAIQDIVDQALATGLRAGRGATKNRNSFNGWAAGCWPRYLVGQSDPVPAVPQGPPAKPPWDAEGDPMIAPANAVPRPQIPRRPALVAVCAEHQNSKCDECLAHPRPRFATLGRCCCLHHARSLPPMVDFCKLHRLGVCGSCGAAGRSAQRCCGGGHHGCKTHQLPSCSLCRGSEFPLKERRPEQCCLRGHHRPEQGRGNPSAYID
jgi:hypothetical protein